MQSILTGIGYIHQSIIKSFSCDLLAFIVILHFISSAFLLLLLLLGNVKFKSESIIPTQIIVLHSPRLEKP